MTNNLKDLRHNEIPQSPPLLFQLGRAAGSPLSGHICLLPPPVVSVSLYRRGERVKARSVVGHGHEMQNSQSCIWYGRERTSTLHQRSALFIDTLAAANRKFFIILKHVLAKKNYSLHFLIWFWSDLNSFGFGYIYYSDIVCFGYIFSANAVNYIGNFTKYYFFFYKIFFFKNYQQVPNYIV